MSATLPPDEHQRRERQRVAGDDPLQLGEIGAEILLDRRQRDVHHRVVEHDHEEAERDGGRASATSGSPLRISGSACDPRLASAASGDFTLDTRSAEQLRAANVARLARAPSCDELRRAASRLDRRARPVLARGRRGPRDPARPSLGRRPRRHARSRVDDVVRRRAAERRGRCVHRWARETPDREAAVWAPEDGERRSLTWARVVATRCADWRRRCASSGSAKGDAVGTFLPMSPEAAIASHACAHLGAVQVPIFSGFAGPAVSARLADAAAKVVVTADASYRRGRLVPMKESLDEALATHRRSSMSSSGGGRATTAR